MSEVAQVPQLRFPEFSGEWEDGKLGNYGNLINGLTYSPDNIVDDGLLVLRSSNVQNGQIYLNDNVYVNLDVDDAALTKEDDILICVRNGSKRLIGKSTIINKNLPKSTHGAFMTVFRGESNKFISHWFHSSIYYKEVHKNLGATINSINGSNLKKFKTIFPLKPEQQKIAAFLTAVDNKIEQLSKKQELLDEYKKGLMQQIFSQAVRFRAGDTPGQPLLPNGNSPSGSDFPNWEEKRLGDLCEITTGKLDANAMVEGGQYRFYTCAKEYYKIDDYAFDTDALIVSGNGANVGYIHHYQGKFNAYQRTYVLDSFTDNIIFVKFVLDEYLHKRIMKEKNEGNTPYIVMGTLTDMKINLPSFSEQTKIAIFLSSIDSKIEQVGKQLDESKQFKKALLQQMFV